MTREIRVYVVDKGRKNLYMRFRDPVTGDEQERTTGESTRRAAERVAAVWEDELRDKRYHAPDRTTWSDFVARYRDECLLGLADDTYHKAMSILNQAHEFAPVNRLADFNPARISKLQAHWRERGLAESTIASYLAHIRAALSWAVAQGILRTLPTFPRVQRAKRGRRARLMKGRPLADNELQLLLDAVPDSIDEPDDAPAWQFYVRGLWLSGLRLEESLKLHWERNDELGVRLGPGRPMFLIHAEHEKGHTDRVLPMSPEFAEFLQAVPEANRKGFVFVLPRRKGTKQVSADWAGHVLSAIGEQAGIVVDSRTGKFASAHDLRRTFGNRWARKVMPQILMELMRHQTIETTLRYYVEADAEATAEKLWTVHSQQEKGDTQGDTKKKAVRKEGKKQGPRSSDG